MSPKLRADAIDLDALKVNNLERRLDPNVEPPAGTPGWIAWHLRRAFQTLDAMPEGMRPRGYGRAMPAYVHEELDLWFQGTQTADDRRNDDAGRNRTRVRPTAAEISSMHAAFGWLLWLRQTEPGAATTLQAWAFATSRRYNLRRLCRNRGWSYSGFNRKVDRGLILLTEHVYSTSGR